MNELQILGIETIYTFLIVIPSLIIFSKTRGLYLFSNYKGLKYFSNAFLFLAGGFILRFIVMINKIISGEIYSTIQTFDFTLILMEFCLILTGMFLLYSLIWKKFESKKYSKKPININLMFIYGISSGLALIDYVIESFLMMYLSQIILFAIASIISYKKYKQNKKHFRQFYFISMVLFLIVMVINTIAQYTIDAYPFMRFYAYLITLIIIFIFLYITNKLTNFTTKKSKIIENG